jgi:hypothetical protein
MDALFKMVADSCIWMIGMVMIVMVIELCEDSCMCFFICLVAEILFEESGHTFLLLA